MVAQLLGRPEPRAPAPRQGSAELRLADESFVAASSDLTPGVPVSFEGVLPFRKLRESALRDDGMKGEFRWDGGDGEGEGRMPAAPVLRALHGTLDLALDAGADGVWRGRLRVPDVLAGFKLRGAEGSWTVDGAPAEDGLLCDPCERGRRMDIEFRGSDGDGPRARIVDRGYPDLAESSGVPAIEWLRALEGDNRRYRQLSQPLSGSSASGESGGSGGAGSVTGSVVGGAMTGSGEDLGPNVGREESVDQGSMNS